MVGMNVTLGAIAGHEARRADSVETGSSRLPRGLAPPALPPRWSAGPGSQRQYDRPRCVKPRPGGRAWPLREAATRAATPMYRTGRTLTASYTSLLITRSIGRAL